MCDEIVTLWTIHSPDFDLTSGRVDHSKSKYYLSVSGAKEAYHELWRRLNTPEGQIIWCYTVGDDIAKTGLERIKWELQMPRKKVICFLDSLVWNRILGIKCRVGNNMRRQWIRKAINKFPYDSDARDAYVDQCYEDFWNQQPKTGSWWDELFVQNAGECVDAIIHHPVPDNFVKEHITWCCR